MSKTSKISFSFTDAMFAIITFLFGFELYNLSMYGVGIGLTAFYILFSAVTVCYAKFKGGNLVFATVGGVCLSLFSLWYLFVSNGTLSFWSVIFTVIFVPYWYFVIFSVRPGVKFLDGNTPFDIIKSLFSIPFKNYGRIFPALGGFGKLKKQSRLFEALLGIFLTVIPTAVIFVLLFNAGDGLKSAFGGLYNIFDDIFSDISDYFPPLILGIPISMYLYGTMYGCSESDILKSDYVAAGCNNEDDRKKLNGITVLFATLPLILILVLYTVAESASMLRGALGNKSLSAAAVKGFFELCAATVISAAFIAGIYFFSQKENGGKPAAIIRLCTVLVSLLNICIVCLAVWKLYLYIDKYGLTAKRVYAATVIFVILILFIMLIIKQYVLRFCLIRSVCICAAAVFCLLCFCNVNRGVAAYNINRSVSSGFTKELDVESIVYDLGYSGIIRLDKAYDRLDKPTKKRVKAVLKEYKEALYDDYDSTFRSFNTEVRKAKKILESKY